MRRIELTLDVSDAVNLAEAAHIAATLFLPDNTASSGRPVICFAKPGGGFSRHYYAESLPGLSQSVSQAAWHVARGWIFVCLDHLGVGDSSQHQEELNYAVVAAANQAAEEEIVRRLTTGELADDGPIVDNLVRIGIGQSMGGSLTVVQQGRYHWYHGIAILGFSAVHTHPAAPGAPPVVFPWRTPEASPASVVLNAAVIRAHSPDTMREVNRRLFFYDDLDDDLTSQLLSARDDGQPEFRWRSATVPLGVISRCLTPGIIAPEAAAVTAPVLVAMGERDVIADPKGEPRAYLSAQSVDLFICPRMGHMHNFATTRELFWQRIHFWGEWVASQA